MGVADRDYMRSRGRGLRVPESWTWRLILACAVLWFVRMAAIHWVGVPIDGWLGLSADGLGRGRVWTVVTYAFLHADFGHLLWNAFGIWVFGSILERSMARGEFLLMTAWAAVAGGVAYVIGDLVMGTSGYVIGASGILSAYLALAALRFPRMPLRLLFLPFFSIPLWLVAVLVFAGDIMGAAGGVPTRIAYWAHLGGAAYGLAVFRFGVLPRLPSVRLRAGGGPGGARSRPGSEPRRDITDDGARVDALLDKINRQGIGSLSDAEREFLNEASKRYH